MLKHNLLVCGIDIGASAAKLVLLDAQRRVVGKAVRRSGIDYAETAERCLADALAPTGTGPAPAPTDADATSTTLAAGPVPVCSRDHIAHTISTGYGRDNVPWADGKMTEIACHGKGAFFHFPQRMTVIDIGAQDSKLIHLDDRGHRTGFQMNRKCAAGTGAFLEEIALRLDLPLGDLNALAERSTHEIALGSFCTVFAASEILEKIRAGQKVEDIVKGAFRSVVKRILEMDTIDSTLVMTGGVVAHNRVLVKLVEESFGKPVLVPPEPQFVGALGAALFRGEGLGIGD